MSESLRLQREQLNAICGDDPDAIRVFERLFQLVNNNSRAAIVIGGVQQITGNVRQPSAAFPYFCMTNFEGAVDVSNVQWPDWVPILREERIIYLEGQTGETTEFSGIVAGSVITLDNTTANIDVLAALNEDQLAFGTFTNWRTVDIAGVTFSITALNSSPGVRTITVDGTPSSGTQSVIFYPHRISDSTTEARIISWRGCSPVGAGTTETISGLLRRDQLQGHYHLVEDNSSRYPVEADIRPTGANGTIAGTGSDTNANFRARGLITDGTNGEPRIGSTTHGPDFVTHLYQYGGRFVA